MNAENTPITLNDKQLDEMIKNVSEDMDKAAQLQEQALAKRLILQGQLNVLLELKEKRGLAVGKSKP